MKIRDIVAELTRPATIRDAQNILARYGYYKIGGGRYGTVMAKEDKPFVLKLFSSNDYGYRRYLELVQARQNKHFPQIRGKPVKVTGKYWAIRLERLDESDSYTTSLGALAAHWLTQFIFLSYEGQRSVKFQNDYRSFYERFPELVEALELIARYVLFPANCGHDLRGENIMRRGKTLVVTDPVAWRKDVYQPLVPTLRQQNLPIQLPRHDTPPGIVQDDDDLSPPSDEYEFRQRRFAF